jgi:ABC-type antimicrobial peptide transport system permease subunit
LSAFGVLAIMLAMTGIYGLAAYTVSRRVREIGIRIAVGARPVNVLRLVFTRTAVLVGVGSLAGLALGALASQVLASVVTGVSARDPLVISGGALTMMIVGTAAVLGVQCDAR